MLTKEAIEKYFMAEKAESVLFMGIAAVAIVVAVICFFVIKTPQCKGAAIPFILVGLLLGIVGFTVYKKSDEDRIRNVYALTMNPAAIQQSEAPRMDMVLKKFTWYRYTEMALAIIGVALFCYYRNCQAQAFYKGIGMGLFIMASVALTVDYFAAKRAQVYSNLLKTFIEKN